MLDVKKTISKISNWINLNRIRIITQSGTTNVQGALRLSNLPSDDVTVLAVTVTSSGGVNWFGLPFKYSNSNWYAKVLDWQNLGAQGNKTVSLKIWYIVGGVLRSCIFKAFSHLQKIGGGLNAGCKETASKDAYSHTAYRKDVHGELDCNIIKSKRAKGDKLYHSSARDLYLYDKDPDLQSERLSIFCTAIGLIGRWLVRSGAGSSELHCNAYGNHDLLCGNVNVESNELHIHRARLPESGPHNIIASERRWAVC